MGARGVARSGGIDVIRVLMTLLVVLHHAAIGYGGAGGWYWRQEPDGSSTALVIFNAVNQSYFMGLFFMLAGYFTPLSYDRKGAARFLMDRVVRLGLPLLAFFFVLNPLTIAIARKGEGFSLASEWWRLTLAGDFAPGPLWFALALLIFCFAYAGWRLMAKGDGWGLSRLPSFMVLAAMAVAISLVSFAVRLAVPVGRNIFWLQLGYFPFYIFLFVAGCATAKSRLLEGIEWRDAWPWMLVSVIALAVLPVMILTRGEAGGFDGGWNFNALFYALWDPLVAFGVILALLRFAPAWGRGPGFVRLARLAFGAFIVHAPVLVALSVWTADWPASPLIKFAAVGAMACAASFAMSAMLRFVPGVRRVI